MINLNKQYRLWFLLSGLFILAGMLFMILNGLNYGIDFTGGTMLHFRTEEATTVEAVQQAVSEFYLEPDIQHAGEQNLEVIIKTKSSLSNEVRERIFSKLKSELKVTGEDFLSVEQFGPSMGSEIRDKALISIALASVLMLVYISLRFEAAFGIAAIASLLHDVLFLLAAYAIFRFPVNSTFIAAVLTVVGYSINDTIVIFDRIREDVKHENVKDYFSLASVAVNKTLSRTISTSVTTLLAIVVLFLFGSQTIKEFAMPLFIGVTVGTYSSIFIASTVWAMIRTKIASKGKYQQKAKQ